MAYVKQVEWPDIANGGGRGAEPLLQGGRGLALVPEDMIDEAIEAAEECPGECIHFHQE